MSDFIHVLTSGLGMMLFFLAQLAALALIPLGLPGTFLQVVAALAIVAATDGAKMSWWWVALFLVLALLGEVVDFLSGQWGARRFGGSKQAAWGALIGGMLGVLFGAVIPVPIVGSVIGSFAGTFAGAIIGEMREQKKTDPKKAEPNLRVGFGALLGKALAVGVKLFIGFLIAIISVVVVVGNSV